MFTQEKLSQEMFIKPLCCNNFFTLYKNSHVAAPARLKKKWIIYNEWFNMFNIINYKVSFYAHYKIKAIMEIKSGIRKFRLDELKCKICGSQIQTQVLTRKQNSNH